MRKSTTDLPLGARIACRSLSLGQILCLTVLAFLSVSASAQKVDKNPRKLVFKESPHYPLMLKEAHIGGIVRLEIVISPKGNVDSVAPLGGNPVLVEASSTAVRKWKYVPADFETKTQVEFTFDPTR